jgi:NADH dehydrogenase
MESSSAKHVLIVGGGFAGLNCALKLAQNSNVRVTLIDKNNYQQFQPLLYQVATAALAPNNAAFALRNVFRRYPNVDIKMGEVVSVDLETRTAETANGQKYQGDYLVLATGSQVNFFGTPGADKHAYPLYSLHDAEVLRSRILAVLEAADRDPSLVAKGALNFVIVGAGPTGTELAGTLGDITHRGLKDLYKNLDLSQAKVFLVDRGHHVLNAFTPKSQEYAARMLEQRGVQVKLGTSAQEITSGHLLLSDGTSIPTRTVIWAGGLQASSLSNKLGIPVGHGGRLDVQPDLSLKDFPGVYALGDFANIAGADGKPLPQLASVAEQAGKYCGKNLLALIGGEPVKPFHYLDKGIMAMIGRNAAVAELGAHRHELQGPIAFTAWLGVHAALLTTVRAKIDTVIEWGWDYFGRSSADAVLDRTSQANTNWNEDEEETPTPT